MEDKLLGACEAEATHVNSTVIFTLSDELCVAGAAAIGSITADDIIRYSPTLCTCCGSIDVSRRYEAKESHGQTRICG